MKKVYYTICMLAALCVTTSCDDFLDKMPDKRAEINSSQKISELLVSAYPNVDPMMIYEHRTDNVMDNGRRFGEPERMIVENYFWEDISETDWDAPEALWNSCYGAIAAANQALDAIRILGPNSGNGPQRGEALLCRAYAHFLLVNTFCQPYRKSSASSDMGIPYVEEPETVIGKQYDRGTVASVYEKIARDIEEGFPLINDNSYAVPLYHFNKRAAAAFACRFYLFYGKYEQALSYAGAAIDEDPSSSLRNLKSYTILTQSGEWRDRFISKDEPANLLLVALRSRWGRNYTTQRYGNSDNIVNLLIYRSSGPWGKALADFDLLFHASGYPVKSQPKYNEIFEVTNETAQTGQPHVVQMAFTTDETLLCRAEVNVMLKQYDDAARDLSFWYVKKGGKEASVSDIIDYYTTRETADKQALAKGELSPWLLLVKPFNATFPVEDGVQEKMLQAVLHARRIETVFSGLRWLDVRRFGIEVVHNVEEKEPVVLPAEDLRRVIQLPQAVTAAGLPANPR